MGEGIDASLLTGLAVAALRNARRAGLPVADQAALADQAVFAQHGGTKYAAALLLDIELATGAVRAIDAGSAPGPRPVTSTGSTHCGKSSAPPSTRLRTRLHAPSSPG